MKLAVVTDEDGNFVPLDMGSRISVIDTDEKKIIQYENPGYNKPHGGKEIAMATILRFQPDAIVAVPGSMCPGSYRMSLNRTRYVLPKGSNLEEFLPELQDVEKLPLLEELPVEIYREDY